MDLGTHISESLLIEMNIMNGPTVSGAVSITTTGDQNMEKSKNPRTDSSDRILPTEKDEEEKYPTTKSRKAMREYTQDELNIVMEGWKKTATGAGVGAVVGGGGYYLAKKKMFKAEMLKLKKEKAKCEDDDCRGWVNDKVDRLNDKMKNLKKKSLVAAGAGAGIGAAAVNAKDIGSAAYNLLKNKRPPNIVKVKAKAAHAAGAIGAVGLTTAILKSKVKANVLKT